MSATTHQMEFDDADSGASGLATARATGSVVGIGLSLVDDGDVEVFMSPAGAKRFADLIVAAARDANG